MSSLRLALKKSLQESGQTADSKSRHKIRDHFDESDTSDSDEEEEEEPQPRRKPIPGQKKRGRPPKKRTPPSSSEHHHFERQNQRHRHYSDGDDHSSCSSSENEFSESGESYDDDISSNHRHDSTRHTLNSRTRDPYPDDNFNTTANTNSHSVVSSDGTNDSYAGGDAEVDAYGDRDENSDEDIDAENNVRHSKSSKKHQRAANKIQNQWKKRKHKHQEQQDDDDLSQQRKHPQQSVESSSKIAHVHRETSAGDSGNSSSRANQRHIEENDEPENDSHDPDTHSYMDNNPASGKHADLHARKKKIKKSKQKGASSGKSKTVPAPLAEVLEWSRNLPVKRARKNVVAGLRVKVRFATKVRREGKILRKKKWFGGRVSAVSKEGSKIRIKYDDGTSEISKFPDKDVVVDDECNGEHQAKASKFIPPQPEPQPEPESDSESESDPESEEENELAPEKDDDSVGQSNGQDDEESPRQRRNDESENSDVENEVYQPSVDGITQHSNKSNNDNNNNDTGNSYDKNTGDKTSSSGKDNSSNGDSKRSSIDNDRIHNSSRSNNGGKNSSIFSNSSDSSSSMNNNDDIESDNNTSSNSSSSSSSNNTSSKNTSSNGSKIKKGKKSKKRKIILEESFGHDVSNDKTEHHGEGNEKEMKMKKKKKKNSHKSNMKRMSSDINSSEKSNLSKAGEFNRGDASTTGLSVSPTSCQNSDSQSLSSHALKSAPLKGVATPFSSSLEAKTPINKQKGEMSQKEVYTEKRISRENTIGDLPSSISESPATERSSPQHEAVKTGDFGSTQDENRVSQVDSRNGPEDTNKRDEDKKKSLEDIRKFMEDKGKPMTEKRKFLEDARKSSDEKKKSSDVKRFSETSKQCKPTLTIRIPNVTKDEKDGSEQLSPLSKNDRSNLDYSSEDEMNTKSSTTASHSKLDACGLVERRNEKSSKKRKRRVVDDEECSDASEFNSKIIATHKKNAAGIESSTKFVQSSRQISAENNDLHQGSSVHDGDQRLAQKSDRHPRVGCMTDSEAKSVNDIGGSVSSEKAGQSEVSSKDIDERNAVGTKSSAFDRREVEDNSSCQPEKISEQLPTVSSSTLGTIAEEDYSVDVEGPSTPSPSRDGSASKSQPAVRSGRRAAKQANERIVAKQEKQESGAQDLVGKKRKRKDKEKFTEGRQRKDSDGDNIDDSESSADDDNNWVQCDRCGKWRILPKHVKVSSLPKHWYCEDNVYDSKRNSCDAPEQSITQIVKEKKKSKKRMKNRELNSSHDSSGEGTPLTRKDVIRSAEGIHSGSERSPLPKLDLSRTMVDSAQVASSVPAVDLNSKSKRSAQSSHAANDNLGDPDRGSHKGDKKGFSSTGKKKQLESLDGPNGLIGQIGGMEAKGKARKSGKTRPSKDGKDTSKDPDKTLLVSNSSLQQQEQEEPPCQTQQAKEKEKERDRFREKEKERERESRDKDREQDKNKSEADSLEWVQCEKCEKWRKLPSNISADQLPDVWYCSMNTWNPASASCDSPEDKAEGLQDVGIFGNTPPVHTNSNKLSYRNLIFGSGRKVNRPISERTRAAESLFAAPVDESESGGNPYPTVMYSNSTAFVQRGARTASNSVEDSNSSVSMFELMSHSNLWAQLRGDQLDSDLDHSCAQHRSRISYDGMSGSMKQAVHDLVCRSIGTKTINSDAVLDQIKCCDSENMPLPCLQVREHCDVDVVVSALCALVRQGVLEIIHKHSPDWTMKDWNPRYRLAAPTSVNESNTPTESPPRFTRCMKIAKPWKQSGSQKQKWIH